MEKKPSSNNFLVTGQAPLPEYVEYFSHLLQRQNKHEKHELSDQSLVAITNVLEMSLKDRAMLTIELYDPIEQLQVTGLVDQIDFQRGLFWVNGDSFTLADIEGVELHGANIKGKV